MIRCKWDKNHPSSPTSSLHPDPLRTDLSAPGKWRNSPDKITVSWQRSRYVLFVDRSERMRRAKRRNLNRAPTLVSHANPKLPISLAILSSRRGPRGGTGVYGINNCQFRRARDRRETVRTHRWQVIFSHLRCHEEWRIVLAVGRNRPFVLTRLHRSLQRRIRRRPVENFVPLLKPALKRTPAQGCCGSRATNARVRAYLRGKYSVR